MGLVRRVGKMLHDWAANTGMIYLWDANLARVRLKAPQEEPGGSAMTDDNGMDEVDQRIENGGFDEKGGNSIRHEGREVLLRRSSHPNDSLSLGPGTY